jgi:tetratricopeptide (TPR) repeat protein
VSVAKANGFARLVFQLAEEVESEVRLLNGVVVITFKQPVEVAIDRIASGAADYIGAARRDPDGKGVRIALTRKVTVNSMAAGDRLFVDLLPDTWTGVLPGLPQEAIDNLARRARDAEKKARQQIQLAEQRKQTPIRVHVGKHPTFARYIFDLPPKVSVSNDRVNDQLTLVFDAPLKFDLADARADLPRTLETIETDSDTDSVSVRFAFAGKVDVRTFREDNSYVVDVTPAPVTNPAEGLQAENSDERINADVASGEESLPGTAPPVSSSPAADMPRTTGRGEQPIAAPSAADAAATKPPQTQSNTVVAGITRQGDNLRLTFAFASETPAAVFRRADTLWLVFDSSVDIDVAALNTEPSRTIRNASLTRTPGGVLLRLKLGRPRLIGLAAEGPNWTVTIGGTVADPTRPLLLARNIADSARSSIVIPFDDPRQLHRISDPEIGDTLFIVTALGPARGFLKAQDFVEFRALASTHGVVVQPLADDLQAELAADKIMVGRPAGLALSGGAYLSLQPGSSGGAILDPRRWNFDRQADFTERQSGLLAAAAAAPENRRSAARLDLARFYLARGMNAEAKAVLDVALASERPTIDDMSGPILRAIANMLLERADEALKELANPLIGNRYDAPLWRALAQALHGKYGEAREGFKNVAVAMAMQPIGLQHLSLREAVRASIEVRDFDGAAHLLHEFETIGIPREFEPRMAVLTGRLAEGLGRGEDALAAYRRAAESWDRPAAAQGRLREILLRYSRGDLKRVNLLSELELLTMTWRGDETEAEALQLMAHFYIEEGRYRDAFNIMRTTLKVHPNSEVTRRIHNDAAATFESLYLTGKGEGVATIDALSLFYDFRELTPIGRRGDEIIRRLADRLVDVDLLDQAAELLQYQVDHRLQGAARAQVATRLAVVYLMNRKPDRALTALRATRTADLSNELRSQRLLIEARALSDVGRHNVALEVIANVPGREAVRLRSDILWAARRWADAAEQLEVLYASRWQEWEPLTASERGDILRAAIGFALGDDAIGLSRFREKYAAKMTEGPDKRAFEVVTAPTGTSGAEFRDVAKMVAAVDTLDGFLRDMRIRYPETGVTGPAGAARKAGIVPPPPAANPSGVGANGPQQAASR